MNFPLFCGLFSPRRCDVAITAWGGLQFFRVIQPADIEDDFGDIACLDARAGVAGELESHPKGIIE
jgi:hypothetical protein